MYILLTPLLKTSRYSMMFQYLFQMIRNVSSLLWELPVVAKVQLFLLLNNSISQNKAVCSLTAMTPDNLVQSGIISRLQLFSRSPYCSLGIYVQIFSTDSIFRIFQKETRSQCLMKLAVLHQLMISFTTLGFSPMGIKQ